jgi:hypothetical protein
LRVSAGEYGQLPDGVAWLETLTGEPIDKVGQKIIQRQWTECERIGLPEQRPLSPVEELSHHRRFRAGIDVGRRVAVVFDPGSHETIEVLARGEKVLELVEHDEGGHSVVLVQRLGKIEQPGGAPTRQPGLPVTRAAGQPSELRRSCRR